MTSQETGGVCHLGKRPAQAHGHVCERCERRLPGEGVPAVLTRLIRVGHLPRALATDHARGPRAERRGGALRERVARCARVAPAAAREAQPAVRVLVVLACALVGQRRARDDAEDLHLRKTQNTALKPSHHCALKLQYWHSQCHQFPRLELENCPQPTENAQCPTQLLHLFWFAF